MWQYQAQSAYADEQKYPLGKSATSHSTPFSKLQYRVDATRRAYHRALKALKELEAEAAAAPAPPPDPPSLNPSPQATAPQIGFVLPSPSATPSDPSVPVPIGQYPPLPASHPSTPPLGAVDGCFGRVLR